MDQRFLCCECILEPYYVDKLKFIIKYRRDDAKSLAMFMNTILKEKFGEIEQSLLCLENQMPC